MKARGGIAGRSLYERCSRLDKFVRVRGDDSPVTVYVAGGM